MNKIYIFSFGNFFVEFNNQEYAINGNKYLELSCLKHYDFLKIYSSKSYANKIEADLNNIESNNYFRVFTLNGNTFVEIVACNFLSLTQKILAGECEVFVYENSIRVIFKSVCYCFYFVSSMQNNAVFFNNILYVYNEKNILVFDCNLKTFNLLKVEKFEKNNKKIEILCKIPHNYCYFLLFLIDLSLNKVEIKKYKKGEINYSKESLPYAVFYLIKFKFDEAKKYLENISYEKILSYFGEYENIACLNNEFYLCNHFKVTPVKFEIENNKIVDIDW